MMTLSTEQLAALLIEAADTQQPIAECHRQTMTEEEGYQVQRQIRTQREAMGDRTKDRLCFPGDACYHWRDRTGLWQYLCQWGDPTGDAHQGGPIYLSARRAGDRLFVGP